MIQFIKRYLRNEDYTELVTKSISFFAIRILGTVFSFLFTLYITNTFGKEVWGLFAMALSVFAITGIVGVLGLDTNLVKFFSNDSNIKYADIYFKSLIKSFVFSSILSFVVYIFSDFVVNDVLYNPKPKLLLYFKWILPSIPFWSVVLVSCGVLRARKYNRSFAFYTLAGRFFLLLLALYIFSIEDIELILKAYLFTLILLSISSVIHVIFILKKISISSDQNSWSFLKDSIPMMLSTSILALMSWLDTFIVGVYEEESEVGIYSVAVKITSLTLFSIQAINSILAPKIAKSYAKNEHKNYLNMIKFSTRINFYITLFIIFLIISFNRFLFGLFGDGFQQGFWVLVILCFGQLVNSLSGSVGVVMQMTGEQRKYQNIILVSLSINLVLTFILTPIYGGIGAALATIFSMIYWNINSAIYLKRKKNIQTYFIPF